MGKRKRAADGTSHPAKQARKQEHTTNSICKDVLASHTGELLDILTRVKNGKIAIDKGPPEALTRLLDNMIGQVVQRQKQDQTRADEEKAGLLDKLQAGETAAMPATASFSNEIRTLLPLKAWTLEDIPDDYPPLPPILDPSQERIAMTHQGAIRPDWQMSYETMEFLGDSFIYHISSEMIVQTFPTLSSGRCSQIRERIVRNSTLSEYSLHYALNKRAALPEDFDGYSTSGKPIMSLQQRQKVYADLFESYVAALIRSDPQGVLRAQQWLRRLWAMTIARDIQKEYRRRSNMDKRVVEDGRINYAVGKERLAVAIACKLIRIRYEDARAPPTLDRMSGLPMYGVEVWVDAFGKSDFLAHGIGISKKEAGAAAAERAMENKQKMDFYLKKKAEYVQELKERRLQADKAQMAEQEAAEAWREEETKEKVKAFKTAEKAVDSESDGDGDAVDSENDLMCGF